MTALSKPNYVLDIVIVTYKTFIILINFKSGQSISSPHCSRHSIFFTKIQKASHTKKISDYLRKKAKN